MCARKRQNAKPPQPPRRCADIALVPTDAGLRGKAIQVYVALQRRGALSDFVRVNLSEIARAEHMHRNTVRAALERLAGKKLARRSETRRAYWRVWTSPQEDSTE